MTLRKHCSLMVVGAAPVVWAIPLAAHAQVAAADVNPPKAEDLLVLSAQVSAEYDSNVARTSREGALLRGIERQDVVIDPSVSVELNRAFGRHQLMLSGDLGYNFYMKNSDLNREHVRVDGSAMFNFVRCGANVTAGYNRQQSDLRDINIIAAAPPQYQTSVNAKNTAQTTQVSAIASCGGAVGLRPVVFGGYEHYTNSDLLRRISNYDSYTFGAGIQYTNPVLADISLFGTRTKTDYPDRNTTTTGGVPFIDGYKSTGVGLRAKRDIGAALAALAEVSYINVDTDGHGEGFDGVTWRGEVTFRANPNLRFVGTVGRAVTPSRGVFSDYDVSKNAGVSMTYVISPKATVTADYQHEDLNHRGVDEQVFGQRIVFEHFNRVSTQLALDVARPLRMVMSLGYERRNANGSLYDYDSFQAAVSAQFTF